MPATPKKSKNFVHLDDCKKQFERFLTDEEAGIFVLKGNYGCGKSEFVRRTILKEKIYTDHFPFSSQISLFGCKDLDSIEDRTIGALKIGAKGVKVKHVDNALLNVQKIFKETTGGIDLQLSVKPLFWNLACGNGFLLVIDDLDRKADQLSIKEIIGFASMLVEQSERKTKIILILDEDSLGESDKTEWDGLREKFLDYEFRFHPSPRELAEEYVESPDLVDRIGEIHTTVNSPNIRMMKKVESHVKNLRKFLAEKQIEISSEQCAYAAGAAFLFLRSGTDYCVSDLRNGRALASEFDLLLLEEDESKEDTERREKLKHLTYAIQHYQYTHWDRILFEFFDTGSIRPESLKQFTKELPEGEEQEAFSRHEQRLDKLLYQTFSNNGAEIVDEIFKGVNEFPEHCSIDRINDFEFILRELGHSNRCEKMWSKWIERFEVDSMSIQGKLKIQGYLPKHFQHLVDPSEGFEPTQVNPTEILLKFDHYKGPADRSPNLSGLEHYTPDQWAQWLLQLAEEDKRKFNNLPDALSSFLSWLREGEIPLKIGKNLAAGMRKFAATEPIHQFRFTKLFPASMKKP